MMEVAYSVGVFIYGILVLKLYISWKKMNTTHTLPATYSDKSYFLSVIIPVRNESENILDLLQDINVQRLPRDKFEVIVVDDESSDGTVEIINECKHNFSFNLKICHLQVAPDFKGSHKKMALALGINSSKGDYIVTTDGDCRVKPTWLSSLYSFIAKEAPACITGPVTFEHGRSLFQDIQILEFSFLIGTGAASLNMGFANMCNGANLAFSKRIFYEVKGYEGNTHIHSGDDEFMMHKIFRKYPKKVKFFKSQGFIVTTKAKPTLKSLFYQRRRWAGKWKMYSDSKISLLAAFYFIFNLLHMIAFISMTMGEYPLWMFLTQIFARGVIDFLFIKTIMKFLGKPLSLSLFTIAEVVYPFYIVGIGIAANFGHYEWKGRKIK